MTEPHEGTIDDRPIAHQGWICPEPGPDHRRTGRGRHPGRGRQDRGRRPEPLRGRGPDHRRHRRHRHPGLHRHPPAHVGDVDPDVRPGLHARRVLRRDPRPVRPELPARRRVRGQPVGRSRVRQRRHHDPRRLVAHHEHAGPRRRGGPRPAGVGHPVRVRLRLPEHLAPGLVVRPRLRGQPPEDRRRPGPAPPDPVLQLERQPGHDGARHARHELLSRGRRPLRVGAGQGARPQHHGPRRDVPLRLHQDAAAAAQGARPPVPEHDVHPLLAPRGRRVADGRGLGQQRVLRAADRAADGSWLGAGGQGARLQRADRAVVRRGHHGIVGPVHPDARDLRAPNGRAATRSPGTRTSSGASRRASSSRPATCWPWRPSAVPRSPASPIGPAP